MKNRKVSSGDIVIFPEQLVYPDGLTIKIPHLSEDQLSQDETELLNQFNFEVTVL